MPSSSCHSLIITGIKSIFFNVAEKVPYVIFPFYLLPLCQHGLNSNLTEPTECTHSLTPFTLTYSVPSAWTALPILTHPYFAGKLILTLKTCITHLSHTDLPSLSQE